MSLRRFLPSVKIVLIGDSSVGKSKIIERFITESYTNDSNVEMFTKETKTIKIDRKRVKMEIIATSGSPSFDRLRPIHYKDADYIIVCYRDGSTQSLRNVEHKWIPEVKKMNKTASILLVATKTDLTPNGFNLNQELVTKIEQNFGIRQHIKCSALNGFNVNTIFLTIAHWNINSDSRRKSFSRKINKQMNTLVRTTYSNTLFKI